MRSARNYLLALTFVLLTINEAKAQVSIFDGGISTQVRPYVGAGLFYRTGEKAVIGPRLSAAVLKGDKNAGLLSVEFDFRKSWKLYACDGTQCDFPRVLMFGGGLGPTIATNGGIYPTLSSAIGVFSRDGVGISLGLQYTYMAHKPLLVDDNKARRTSVTLLYLAASIALY